jgi:hypothetical protein
VKEDAARLWLYMADTYKVTVTAAQRAMFEEWSKLDPVDEGSAYAISASMRRCRTRTRLYSDELSIVMSCGGGR